MRANFSPLLIFAIVALAIAALPGCRKETINKPDAPGMGDVLDAFASPTGSFDATTAATIRKGIEDAASGLLGAGVTDRIVSAVEDAVREAEGSGKSNPKALGPPAASSSTVAPRNFVGDGFGKVTRICDGWGPQPTPDDAANGHLALTLTFSEKGLDPILWGDAERCLYAIGGRRLRLDRGGSQNDLRLFVGAGASLSSLTTTPIVLALDVGASLDDKPIASKLAVRFVYKAAEVELLVPVVDGSVVVTVSGSNPQKVRAKNGTFQCDVATKRCKAETGVEVTL